MEPNELLIRFKQFQKCVMVLLATLLVLGVVASVAILVRLRAILNRPVYVSCSGSSYSGPPADGVASMSTDPALDLAEQGLAGVSFSFRLASKIPGSEVLLAYKIEGQDVWETVPMKADRDEPLTYKTSVPMDINDEFEYRLEQVIGGEIVHASRTASGQVALLVGNGDAHVELLRQDDKSGELWVYQHPYSKIRAYQIDEVRLRVNRSGQKQPEEYVLKGENGKEGSQMLKLSLSLENLRDVDVTVVYKDGEIRTATLNPYAEVARPLIKR
ncbi:MAG TPA: hypothetical protein GXX23_05900 [Firmicutes bacterium]|nr:hypothetical protein [Candidatus Fermentithermobacillaceae bacterium]